MGLDWSFVFANIPIFAKALVLTLRISFFGILGAVILGMLVSFLLYYQMRFLKNIAKFYIELSRNTPLLIHLFFLYYGLGQVGIKIDAYHCAVIGVIFLGGSYMAESFRMGLESVAKSQIESAKALGLSTRQILGYVILPQSLIYALPPLAANVIFLLKETSVVSAIALVDVVFVTKDLIGTYYKTKETLLLLILTYLIVLLPLSLFFLWLERRYKRIL
ncbi:amino acid ABC transporter integral membrane protein [Helicobacter mustelae]|uniref:amino acid ABC transporter permease n=1 Tax=Helicobacter mustelae TaxID=217 RepID=UPI000E02FFD7|nr:amino acid ABC transporter permease [Helicobacter mustelae]STP12249.1 amino acid ABC transporter integral membrane protein [Helicobacter mustelae]